MAPVQSLIKFFFSPQKFFPSALSLWYIPYFSMIQGVTRLRDMQIDEYSIQTRGLWKQCDQKSRQAVTQDTIGAMMHILIADNCMDNEACGDNAPVSLCTIIRG